MRQIELCCKDCESDEEAVRKGRGTVCPGSNIGASAGDPVDIRFNAEMPGCLDDFEKISHQYLQAFAEVAGVQFSKVSVLWTQGCGSDSRRRRRSKPTEIERYNTRLAGSSDCSASQATSEAGLPGQSDSSLKFGIEVGTSAGKLDETWAKLSEDRLNDEFARKCLPPLVISQAADPSDSSADVADLIFAIVILVVIIVSLIYVIYFCCCRKKKVSQEDAGAWENMSWDQMYVQYRAHWEVLGWNRMNWNNEPGATRPATENKSWNQLNPREQASAQCVGYDQSTWDSDSHPQSLPPLPSMPAGQVDPKAALMGHLRYVPPAVVGVPVAPPPYNGSNSKTLPPAVFCVNCGFRFPSATARFCAQCGTTRPGV